MFKNYKLGETIAKGLASEMFHAVDKRGKKCSIKKILPLLFRNPLKEVEANRRLHHKGIIKLLTSFEENSDLFLVFEPLEGKNLLSIMNDRNFEPFSEKSARKIFFQIAEAIQHSHRYDVAHRDLKAENIIVKAEKSQARSLFKKDKTEYRVKVINFNLCTIDDMVCNDDIGNIDFSPPETLLGKMYSGKKADIWALGTLLHILFFADLAFDTNERMQFMQRNRVDHPCLNHPKTISPSAKDLLEKLLAVDPAKRIDIEQVMQHRWMKGKKKLSKKTPK